MLSSIRKFSTSIYAKILLGIVVIPFVFWGMGSSFRGGNKNVIVSIDKEKFSTKEFVNFLTIYENTGEKINLNKIDNLLSVFIGNKIIQKEYNYFDIKLSNHSLSKLIKIQKEFERENKFSRTEYEKFLLQNNLDAVSFEKNLADQEKKRQLLSLVGGGLVPTKFMVNNIYNKINQKREVELINLNDVFSNEIVFNENEIKSYYEKNKDKYNQIYKSIKILELNPKELIGTDEYDNIFFQKLDDIHDSIIAGEKFDSIIKKYNLIEPSIFKINNLGQDSNYKKIISFPEELINDIFLQTDLNPVLFLEKKDKYFIIEIFKTENIQKDLNNKEVKKDIRENLELLKKRKLMSNLISKINEKKFSKSDFNNFSRDKKVIIQKINLKNLNDSSILKEQVVNQIYSFPEKKIIVAHDLYLRENFLIYIDKIINASIDETSDEYEKYYKLSEVSMTNGLFNTYDKYIKGKYKIDINYKTLKTIKNNFN